MEAPVAFVKFSNRSRVSVQKCTLCIKMLALFRCDHRAASVLAGLTSADGHPTTIQSRQSDRAPQPQSIEIDARATAVFFATKFRQKLLYSVHLC